MQIDTTQLKEARKGMRAKALEVQARVQDADGSYDNLRGARVAVKLLENLEPAPNYYDTPWDFQLVGEDRGALHTGFVTPNGLLELYVFCPDGKDSVEKMVFQPFVPTASEIQRLEIERYRNQNGTSTATVMRIKFPGSDTFQASVIHIPRLSVHVGNEIKSKQRPQVVSDFMKDWTTPGNEGKIYGFIREIAGLNAPNVGK